MTWCVANYSCLTEKKLYFNLTGEDSVIIDGAYIQMITQKSGLRLETVLEFVRLPKWKADGAVIYRSKRKELAAPEATSPPAEFPDPYVGLFDWLWDECKVRKILTLEVDDMGSEPHTNRGIRASLRGPGMERDFKIEVWKWKKFDMCVDTLVTVAPKVREVHLFSSGNTAVLRAWSARSGLGKLADLEKLFVEIYPTVRPLFCSTEGYDRTTH